VLATPCLAATFEPIAVLGPAPALAEFGSPQTISDAGSQDPQGAVDPDGDAVALWQRAVGDDRRIEAGFRPQDGSLGTPQTIPDPGQSFDPRVAVDAQGGAVAVSDFYVAIT
jgi:hypothetical protein